MTPQEPHPSRSRRIVLITLGVLPRALPVLIPAGLLAYAWAFGAGVDYENGIWIARLVGPPPCQGERAHECLAPEPDGVTRFTDPHACDRGRADVCIVPMGAVPAGDAHG